MNTLCFVLIEPVVEGVVTGFLCFLTPPNPPPPQTHYYQQSGDSTKEVRSRDLKVKHNKPFTQIYQILLQ